MFIINQSPENIALYKGYYRALSAFSQLFNEESEIPFLHYRFCENIFCLSFNAENLARSDIAIDAKYNNYGIGIKTFLHKPNNESFEKISEFNKESVNFQYNEELSVVLGHLRNRRLQFAADLYGIDPNNLLYHYITRARGMLNIYEIQMDFVKVQKISIKSKKANALDFTDGVNNYRFNRSKNTLFQLFPCKQPIIQVETEILANPYQLLYEYYNNLQKPREKIVQYQSIIIPLYGCKNKKRHVFEKSGLNHWNAGGRPRDADEVYLPISTETRQNFPDFFPPRHYEFNLHLPNKSIIKASVCQDNGKAIMSNPNKALGKWILRDILKISYGKVLTIDDLDILGIDSLCLTKIDNDNYKINIIKSQNTLLNKI